MENGDSDCYQHSHRNSHFARRFQLRVSSWKAESKMQEAELKSACD